MKFLKSREDYVVDEIEGGFPERERGTPHTTGGEFPMIAFLPFLILMTIFVLFAAAA